METRLYAVLAVRSGTGGTVIVTISPVLDGEQVTACDATLVPTAWPEGDELVRGRVRLSASDTVACFQTAARAFTEFAAALDMSRSVAQASS